MRTATNKPKQTAKILPNNLSTGYLSKTFCVVSFSPFAMGWNGSLLGLVGNSKNEYQHPRTISSCMPKVFARWFWTCVWMRDVSGINKTNDKVITCRIA